jgi:hypothetical protein
MSDVGTEVRLRRAGGGEQFGRGGVRAGGLLAAQAWVRTERLVLVTPTSVGQWLQYYKTPL